VQTIIHHGIDQVDRETWQQVTAGQPFAGYDWCRYGEAVLGGRAGYYAIVRDGDQIVGGASFWVLQREIIPVDNPLVKGMIERYLQARPLVVARTARGTDHRGVYLPVDPAQRPAVLTEIRHAGRDVLRECRGSFLLCDYLTHADLDSAWGAFMTLPDFMLVGTYLDITPYASFDDYKQMIRQQSKGTYKDLKRHMNRCIKAGVEIVFQPTLPPDQVVPARQLMRDIRQKYDDDYDDPASYAYEANMIEAHTLVPETFWMLAYLDGRLVACSLMLYDARTGTIVPKLFGRDDDVDFLYFHAHYSVIQHAIDHLQANIIIGDIGAERYKQRIGYVPDTRNNFAFYAASPIARAISRLLLRFYTPDGDW
jgi:hypothetical protein